jgi:methylated-DNA-[protein]-cysteine S-methyltransferase
MSTTRRDETKIGLTLARDSGRGVDAESARLARRFAEAAAREGAAEITYATFDSPIGEGLIASTPRGVVRVGLPGLDREQMLEEMAAKISPRLLEAPGSLTEPLRELDEYFDGRRESFDLPLDWSLAGSPFRRDVLEATARVPFGHVITYGDAAEQAGNRRAHRAAGTALGQNPIPLIVPCHRVVRSGGVLGNYGGGPEMKRWLLGFEGAIETG